MSSPHVAGLAALLVGADPSLTPAEVRQIIRDGAIDMGPAGFEGDTPASASEMAEFLTDMVYDGIKSSQVIPK